jgi:integrase
MDDLRGVNTDGRPATGLDPGGVSGHSLRAGFVTAAARRGSTERAIANQTGHRSMLVLRGYIRRTNVFEQNAATEVGL